MRSLAPNPDRFRIFVNDFAALLTRDGQSACMLAEGADLLRDLVSHDDWLPDQFAHSDAAHYCQYLLHCDSAERFCVVSFVWGPGQSTPIHDHRVWGLIGVLRGSERTENFRREANGLMMVGPPETLVQGEVTQVSPDTIDIHRVANALDDVPSVSIHVYGANIGACSRSTYSEDGSEKTFISGYSNALLPNIWMHSPS